MKVMNWVGVEESTPFEKLPAGGYVIRIVDVEDVADREYLNVVYDVAEGEYAGFYSDDFGQKNPWSHRFVRSYKGNCEGMFKQFLSRLEDSNPQWTVAAWTQTCDPMNLIGLTLGAVFQFEEYTNEQGDDKERLNLVGVYSVGDIRAGNFKVPERKDNRTHAAPKPKVGGGVRVGVADTMPAGASTRTVMEMPPTPQPPVQPVQTVAPAPYPAYPPQPVAYPATRPVPYDPTIPF